jgi:hypothetical protein
MYYPLLRGKQYELLALRECAGRLASTSILPVIEPVRDLATNSGSIWRCLTSLREAEATVAVIINPRVGEYSGDPDATRAILRLIHEVDPDNRNITIATILDGEDSATEAVNALLDAAAATRPHVYLHGPAGARESDLQTLQALASDVTHIAEEKSRVRRYASFSRNGARVAKLSDPFQKADRNSEYRDCVAYPFTDWNVYHSDDGYVGYSDYATIGAPYSTSGFTPRAVAIHLTYTNKDDGTIWIQHFVSQTDRETMANVAAKFAEALEKLVAFADAEGLENPALTAFRAMHASGQFPGLGVIKKLSLVNHLHVAGTTLD